MADKVTIVSTKGEELDISRSALGLWRRKGWLLKEDTTKSVLKSLGESKKKDVTEASDNSEGVS